MKEILEKIEAFMERYGNCNLCRIYEEDGVKRIKLLCYFYENNEGWQLVEFCWGDVALEEFDSDEFDIDAFECGLKQYQTHIGDVLEVYNYLAHYAGEDNDLRRYELIRKEDVTMDTPCGYYLIW